MKKASLVPLVVRKLCIGYRAYMYSVTLTAFTHQARYISNTSLTIEVECYIQGDLCPLCFSNLINIQYIVPTHFSLSVFQPFWAQNTARDTWTLWGNGIRASIVRIPTRVTTSSVAEQKYTSIAAPKKTKSFSQKYKSKYISGLLFRSILKFCIFAV